MSQQLLTVREAALALRCSISWVRALIKSGELAHVKMGRKILLASSAVHSLMSCGTDFNCKTAAPK